MAAGMAQSRMCWLGLHMDMARTVGELWQAVCVALQHHLHAFAVRCPTTKLRKLSAIEHALGIMDSAKD